MAEGSFYGAVLILTLGFKFTWSSVNEQRKVHSEVGSKLSRGSFAPRMYYDDWTPLGHGDPLKHDPTYDYVPPLLDHVHYWEGPLRTDETSLSARKDPPDIDTKSRPIGFPVLPEVPPTMLVPPPLPLSDMTSSTRAAPTTLVQIEPINMVLHSSTTMSMSDVQTSKPESSSGLPWKGANTPMQVTTLPTLQRYETKERPFTRNSLHHQSPSFLKSQPPTIKAELPSSIPIQQGQPFRLPQATKPQNLGKPIKKTEEKESFASLLQSLLDDTPTTTETSERYAATTPAYIATTTQTPMTMGSAASHLVPPSIPLTAPMYLIIQGHSKVKTYGASKAPSMHSIPYNQLLGDPKNKFRGSREVKLDAGNSTTPPPLTKLHLATSAAS